MLSFLRWVFSPPVPSPLFMRVHLATGEQVWLDAGDVLSVDPVETWDHNIGSRVTMRRGNCYWVTETCDELNSWLQYKGVTLV